ncbi:hypothetical protein DFH07DRAFT_784953 [Mycena maculata]|uniref:Uncharacterized protein n=1 Tax=Mycena maculata TaxID=230809 RepID=A0AAD7MI04_9AGAR|nr:hypothetical protein DFH07DRAFT_784953 [Mycena maculata]
MDIPFGSVAWWLWSPPFLFEFWFPLSFTFLPHVVAMMARTKASKPSKPKEMFKAYDPDDVPDSMPFPELALVATTKGEETAVPKLNEHQRSWILDIGVRGVDLPGLTGKAALDFYDEVKTNAFDAKAFQHQAQPGDAVEESTLSALVTAWKRKQRTKKEKHDKATADDGDASDEEEDEGGRGGLLRGYPKAGWRLAIQKVISNKRTAAANVRRKLNKDNTSESISDAAALGKLFNIAAYTGRDKFRDEHHDEINEYAKTLTGTINAGGKFRKAEALLWAEEDHATWDAAAEATDDVNWVERQKLVPSGFKHMVNSLHARHKFRPFVATMLMAWLSEDGKLHFEWQVVVTFDALAEAVPGDIHVRQTFEKKYDQLVKDSINGMYAWAEKPLQEYAATREESAKGAAPVFPLSAEALDDIPPKALAQTVTNFLEESYEAAFGSREIPWAAIAIEPGEYYDAAQFQLGFPSTGLANLTRSQWDDLATNLVSVASAGTSGFFRKAPPPASELPPPPPPPHGANPGANEDGGNPGANPPPLPPPPHGANPGANEDGGNPGANLPPLPPPPHGANPGANEDGGNPGANPPPPPPPPHGANPGANEDDGGNPGANPPPPPPPSHGANPGANEDDGANPGANEDDGGANPPPPPPPSHGANPGANEVTNASANPPPLPPPHGANAGANEDSANPLPPPPPPHGTNSGTNEVTNPSADEGATPVPPPPGPAKKSRKRKAAEQLVPEDVQPAGRSTRTRKTPAEAAEARRQKAAASASAKGKPRYEYVPRSPVKGQQREQHPGTDVN